MNPIIHIKSSENMTEVKDHSASLLVGGTPYFKEVLPYDACAKICRRVYNDEGQRILKSDGVLLIIQTNAYHKGQFVCRYRLIMDCVLLPAGWKLIDERVWVRCKADHFQVPFSHVLVFVPPGGTVTRTILNKRSNDWFKGVWNFPQTKRGKLNGWPGDLCRIIVKGCTEPGDLIVDPFAGSGKLLGIAESMGRHAVGYDISEELIDTMRINGCFVSQNNETLKPIKRGFGI